MSPSEERSQNRFHWHPQHKRTNKRESGVNFILWVVDIICIPLWFPPLIASFLYAFRETTGKTNLYTKLRNKSDSTVCHNFRQNHSTGMVETGILQLKAEEMNGFSKPSSLTGPDSEMFSDLTQSVKRQIRMFTTRLKKWKMAMIKSKKCTKRCFHIGWQWGPESIWFGSRVLPHPELTWQFPAKPSSTKTLLSKHLWKVSSETL